MGSGKHRWRSISIFHRSPSRLNTQPPKEFICAISGLLMADPVIVSSGQTFERNCVQASVSLSFKPLLPDGSAPDFSIVIPNLALKSAILNWCSSSSLHPIPKPLDLASALDLVRSLMAFQIPEPRKPADSSESTRFPSNLSSASEESVAAPFTPLSLTTRPFCYSTSSSSEIETVNPNKSAEEDEIALKLKSSQVCDQEEAVISLRKITRSMEDMRISLCTLPVLSALRSLISSRYPAVQVNSVAALVNLSLEDGNKVKIVRSGIVPPLVDVLRAGFPESQEHAAGALFSLALNDQNKTAIGVLGALPPLLHALHSESERTRHDSALALYHLSLVQSNRVKLVKLGSVQSLLGMLKSGHMARRVMLLLCNLAGSAEGRTAMLDGGAVECLAKALSSGQFESDVTRESCVVALYGLSYGGLRFKGLAKEAGLEGVLKKAEEEVRSERTKEKARTVLEILRRTDEEEEGKVDWEMLLGSGEVTRSRFELACGKHVPIS